LSDFALTKESLRRLRHQPQLGALIGLAERVAGDRARKPALRTDREAIAIDIDWLSSSRRASISMFSGTGGSVLIRLSA